MFFPLLLLQYLSKGGNHRDHSDLATTCCMHGQCNEFVKSVGNTVTF